MIALAFIGGWIVGTVVGVLAVLVWGIRVAERAEEFTREKVIAENERRARTEAFNKRMEELWRRAHLTPRVGLVLPDEPRGEMAYDAYMQGLDQMLEEDLTPWND